MLRLGCFAWLWSGWTSLWAATVTAWTGRPPRGPCFARQTFSWYLWNSSVRRSLVGGAVVLVKEVRERDATPFDGSGRQDGDGPAVATASQGGPTPTV